MSSKIGDWLKIIPCCGVELLEPFRIQTQAESFDLADIKLGFSFSNSNFFELILNDLTLNNYGVVWCTNKTFNKPEPTAFQIELIADWKNNSNEEISFSLVAANYQTGCYSSVCFQPLGSTITSQVHMLPSWDKTKSQVITFKIKEILYPYYDMDTESRPFLDVTLNSLYMAVRPVWTAAETYIDPELAWFSHLPVKSTRYLNNIEVDQDPSNNEALIYTGTTDTAKLPTYISICANNLGIHPDNVLSVIQNNKGKSITFPIPFIDNETQFNDLTVLSQKLDMKHENDLIMQWSKETNNPQLGFCSMIHT